MKRTAPKKPEVPQDPLRAIKEAINHHKPEDEKADTAFKNISEAASLLDVPQHVLRFWESRFSQIKPLKLRGGRRYYRPEDIEILSSIKNLLYKQGYTIKGAKKVFSSMKMPKSEMEKPAMKLAAPKAEGSSPALNEKKLDQIAVIRQELLALRDTLKSRL